MASIESANGVTSMKATERASKKKIEAPYISLVTSDEAGMNYSQGIFLIDAWRDATQACSMEGHF